MYSRSSFKRTPIGPIPEEWEVVDVGDFVDIETGKRAKGGGLTDGKVASIGGEHLDNSGNVTWANMKFVPEDFYNSLTQGKVRVGDVLIVKDGATTGKVAFVKALMYPKVAVNEHVFVVRSQSEDKLLNKFLFYLFFSRIGQEQIKRRFHGIIGGIRREELRSLLIPLPPLPEQRKIAEILSTVDEAIQKVDEAIARTERLKRGLMQKLLTKGIGHKEFKDTEIGRIPKEWEVVALERVVIKIKTGPFGSQLRKNELSDGGAKVYTQENILKKDFSLGNLYISQDKFERFKSMEVKPGDILLTIRGSTGYSAIFPENAKKGIIHTNLAYIRTRKSLITPEYLSLLINDYRIVRSQIEALSSSTTLGALYAKHIKKIKIPCPISIREQQKIVEIVSTINKKLELEKNRKEKLNRIKQGLMSNLLTGKKRVRV